MKYDELLEKAKRISDEAETEDNKIAFVISKDIYSMLLRFKKERKASVVDSKLRYYLIDAFDTSVIEARKWSKIKSCYFLLRYLYLKTFEEDA